MGVHPAIVKLVGQYQAQGDTRKLSELLGAALAFFLGVGGVVALFFVFGLPPLLARYVIAPGELPHINLLTLLLAADMLLVFVALVFSGILYGMQQYYIINWLSVSTTLMNAVLLLLLLPRWKLMGMICCKLTIDLARVVITAFFSRRVLPEVSFHPRLASRQSVRELLSFGSRVFVSSTAASLSVNAQPIIISTAISSVATTYYVMAGRLTEYANGLATAFSPSFMPMFSELQSRDEKSLLASLYFQYSRYLLLIILTMTVVIIAFGTPFISLWVGETYAVQGKIVLIILTASYAVSVSQPLLWRLFIGVGQLDALLKISFLGTGITILGSIILVKPMGIIGVAAAVLFSSILTRTLLLVHTCRYFHISVKSFIVEVQLRPFVVAFCSLAFGLVISAILGTGSYPRLLLGVAGTGMFQALLCIFWGLGGNERAWLRKQIRGRVPSR